MTVTVKDFAKTLKISDSALIERMKNAGLSHSKSTDEITPSDKQALLRSLKGGKSAPVSKSVTSGSGITVTSKGEEWMKENSIAIERGIKGEIAEDFISGLKKLFEDHYIDVPDEKYNVLEDQASKIEELEKKLNEQVEKNVELNKANGEMKRQDIIDEMSADLADTAKEKFNKLAEEVEYSNEKDFTTKVATIKESFEERLIRRIGDDGCHGYGRDCTDRDASQ